MDDVDRIIFDLIEEMNKNSENKDSENLAQTIYKVLEVLKDLKANSKSLATTMDGSAKLSLLASNLKNQLEDLITNYCQHDFKMLLDLAYELIKMQAL